MNPSTLLPRPNCPIRPSPFPPAPSTLSFLFITSLLLHVFSFAFHFLFLASFSTVESSLSSVSTITFFLFRKHTSRSLPFRFIDSRSWQGTRLEILCVHTISFVAFDSCTFLISHRTSTSWPHSCAILRRQKLVCLLIVRWDGRISNSRLFINDSSSQTDWNRQPCILGKKKRHLLDLLNQYSLERDKYCCDLKWIIYNQTVWFEESTCRCANFRPEYQLYQQIPRPGDQTTTTAKYSTTSQERLWSLESFVLHILLWFFIACKK